MKTKCTNFLNILWITYICSMISACGCAQKIATDKKYATRSIENPAAFNRILINGSMDVDYYQSSDGKTDVSIYGPENILDLLEITSSGETLKIQFKKGVTIKGEQHIKVTANSPSLSNVTINGSANVELKGRIKGEKLSITINGSGDIEGKQLKYADIQCNINGSGDADLDVTANTQISANVNGSGDINLQGETVNAILSIAGSGDISAQKMKAENVTANIAGSGDIACNVTKLLSGSIAGTGDITYIGHPPVINIERNKNHYNK